MGSFGWERHISTLRMCGASIGSGWLRTAPAISADSQSWQTPVRQNHRAGTSQASANSKRLL